MNKIKIIIGCVLSCILGFLNAITYVIIKDNPIFAIPLIFISSSIIIYLRILKRKIKKKREIDNENREYE